VKHLLQVAEEGIRNDGGGQAAAVLPRPLAGIASPVWEFFPASRLYDRAHRVITGAGYNSVAEMTLRPEKHLCIPFQRRYDDQAARLRNPFGGSEDGAASAAAFLASLV
jgi:hypothetical protein